jgi:flagellar basal-body rod protein FlgB
MSINFKNAFGVHEAALSLRAQRAEVLAANLANADTPNFKARDIDFSEMFKNVEAGKSGRLIKTHRMHGDTRSDTGVANLAYRIPMQPDTGDGNTVDAQVEQAKFAENAMQYETSLRFLNGKIKGLKLALKGE